MLTTLSIFTQNSDNHFCCLISSNVLFIQPLAFCRNWEQRRYKSCVTRHKANDDLLQISKMKYRNRIPEPGTTISGFADSLKKKKKLMPTDRPYIFLTCDSKHTYIFFWPNMLWIMIWISLIHEKVAGQIVPSPIYGIYKIKWKYRYLTLFFLPSATCLLEKQIHQYLQSLVWHMYRIEKWYSVCS